MSQSGRTGPTGPEDLPHADAVVVGDLVKGVGGETSKRKQNIGGDAELDAVPEPAHKDGTGIVIGNTPTAPDTAADDAPAHKTALQFGAQAAPTPPATPSSPPTPPVYPYHHGSQVLAAIRAARAGFIGDGYYGRPENFATYSQRLTLTEDAKTAFLPMVENFVNSASAFANFVDNDSAPGSNKGRIEPQQLEDAITELNDPNTKNERVNAILYRINPALIDFCGGEFMQSQFGAGFINPLATKVSSMSEPGSKPLDLFNDLGLTNTNREKLIAAFEAALLFQGSTFTSEKDGSFTLVYKDATGTQYPLLKGSASDTGYSIEIDPKAPDSERPRAIVAMSYISAQFAQYNNSNVLKINMHANANPLEIMLNANELICRHKRHVDLNDVSPWMLQQLSDTNKYPNSKELVALWNELLFASTMRSTRRADTIDNWPTGLLIALGKNALLNPYAAVDKVMDALAKDIDNVFAGKPRAARITVDGIRRQSQAAPQGPAAIGAPPQPPQIQSAPNQRL